MLANIVALNYATRKLQLSNYCDESIWVVVSAQWDNNFSNWWTDESNNPTAELSIDTTQTLIFPTDHVTSMAIWGRTRCNFSKPGTDPYTLDIHVVEQVIVNVVKSANHHQIQ